MEIISLRILRNEVEIMRKDYMIITNNPLVLEKLKDSRTVTYKEISYEEVLKEVRDRIHQGHMLLSHPLSGSVKPNETPYKSIMLSKVRGDVEPRSVELIENAILACGKFEMKSNKYKPEVYEDFQLIDWTLLESAMPSADAC